MGLFGEVLSVIVESIIFLLGVGNGSSSTEMRYFDPFVENKFKIVLFVSIAQK